MLAVVESHMQTPHVYVSKISASDMQAGNLPASLSWTAADAHDAAMQAQLQPWPARQRRQQLQGLRATLVAWGICSGGLWPFGGPICWANCPKALLLLLIGDIHCRAAAPAT